MAKFPRFIAWFPFLLSVCVSNAYATTITYSATQLSSSRWRYDYAIKNDALPTALEEFTIFFQENLFVNLVDESILGANWDLLLIQPDTGIPAAGYIDGLSLVGGLGVGASLTGLSVSFDYLGLRAPGSQRFSIIDPVHFNEIDAGVTTPLNATVPVANSLSLAGLALFLAAISVRRRPGEIQ